MIKYGFESSESDRDTIFHSDRYAGNVEFSKEFLFSKKEISYDI